MKNTDSRHDAAISTISHFLDAHADQITAADWQTITHIIANMIRWYSLDEKAQQAQRHQAYTTKRAKINILRQTILPDHLRTQLARLLDVAAIRTTRPRYSMPVTARGHITITPNTCYL